MVTDFGGCQSVTLEAAQSSIFEFQMKLLIWLRKKWLQRVVGVVMVKEEVEPKEEAEVVVEVIFLNSRYSSAIKLMLV
jgi:hypothetical protein